MLALLDQHLLDLGGTYGDPEADDPIQYDELRIGHDEGAVEIVVYNRVIPCSPFLHFLLNACLGPSASPLAATCPPVNAVDDRRDAAPGDGSCGF